MRWLLGGFMASLAAAVALGQEHAEAEALKKATANGKYTRLRTILHMPRDKDEYGEYKDYGYFDGTEWGSYKGLPKGCWVYVHPFWYIWEKAEK
jgi:hypothetical protein